MLIPSPPHKLKSQLLVKIIATNKTTMRKNQSRRHLVVRHFKQEVPTVHGGQISTSFLYDDVFLVELLLVLAFVLAR